MSRIKLKKKGIFKKSRAKKITIKIIFAHPRATSMTFFFVCLFFGSRHLVFDSGLLGNPDVLVFVRDSRVRDWLWLENVLAPLAHPTWGKLLRDLMWFKRFWKLSCQWFHKKRRKFLLSKDIFILSGKENLIALGSIKTKQTFLFNIQNASYV
jgi:hypothetical protein